VEATVTCGFFFLDAHHEIDAHQAQHVDNTGRDFADECARVYFYLDSVIDHTTPLEFVMSIVPAPAGNNSVPS
jgi:hypothetical protein